VKHNPIRHRRTVSRENATLPNPPTVITSSIDPNEYYSPHNYYHYNHQYHYPYHENNHYVQYNSDDPTPMECSSSSVPTFIDPRQSTEAKGPYCATYHNYPYYGTTSSNFERYDHRTPATSLTGVETTTDEFADDEEDDLDAILREPIHWDDDNVEENDEGREKKDDDEDDAFEL
jgi:hypothetical protein